MKPSITASKYLGFTEKPGNMGFNDADFEKKMLAVGFRKTEAWCAYFAELVFKESYPEKFADFDRLFSASAVQTYNNFKAAGYPVHMTPQVDDLVIYQSYKFGEPLHTGHAGIVTNTFSTWQFEDVSGNTSTKGVREGYIVGLNPKRIVAESVWTGLKVLGFATL